MTMPIHSTIAIPASIGTAQAISASVPEKQIRLITTPFSTEYPARAPSVFHPGWPMYSVVGKQEPNAAAARQPSPFTASELRVEYPSPAAQRLPQIAFILGQLLCPLLVAGLDRLGRCAVRKSRRLGVEARPLGGDFQARP